MSLFVANKGFHSIAAFSVLLVVYHKEGFREINHSTVKLWIGLYHVYTS